MFIINCAHNQLYLNSAKDLKIEAYNQPWVGRYNQLWVGSYKQPWVGRFNQPRVGKYNHEFKLQCLHTDAPLQTNATNKQDIHMILEYS